MGRAVTFVGPTYLINGPALASTCFLLSGLSKAPSGVIIDPVRSAIEAA
jgi:hypothetical protein